MFNEIACEWKREREIARGQREREKKEEIKTSCDNIPKWIDSISENALADIKIIFASDLIEMDALISIIGADRMRKHEIRIVNLKHKCALPLTCFYFSF